MNSVQRYLEEEGKRGRQEIVCTVEDEEEGGILYKRKMRRNSVQILYSWKKRKDEFGTEVFGGGRRKVRWGGRRKSVTVGRVGGGGILYSGKRRRKEEFCIKERWEVKRNSVQLEEEEG
jgi:hypothetical protein